MSSDEVTLDTIAEWLRDNGAMMTVTTYLTGLAAAPDTGYMVTLSRASSPPLVGRAVGSLAQAFAQALQGQTA